MNRGEAGTDFLILIGILVLLIFAWLITGGPQKAKEEGLFVSISVPTIQSAGGANLSGQQETPVNDDDFLSGDASTIDALRKELLRIAKRGVDSPKKGSVVIERNTFGTEATRPEEEYLTLVSKSSQPVFISEWRLESALTGKGASIREAAPLPAANRVSNTEPLILTSNQRVVVSSGRSPIGVSFRENICSGYFEQFQDFEPEIELSCPLPEEELQFAKDPITEFGEACLTFIERTPRCTFPLTNLPFEASPQCRAFLGNELSYSACVENHRGDEDFFADQWRVFLGSRTELWKSESEVIRLLDEDGLVVDVIVY